MHLSRLKTIAFAMSAGLAVAQLASPVGAEILHADNVKIKTGNSPQLRLEQDNTSGWTPQTWDVAGNESNFFVRDVTNSSALPFRIRPGAPTSSIDISATGNVGIGTSSPNAKLDIQDDTDAKVLVTNSSGTNAIRHLFELRNLGSTKFTIINTNSALPDAISDEVSWSFVNYGYGFRFSRQSSGTVEFVLFNDGDAELAGALTQNSDVNVKQDIQAIDQAGILDKVIDLPITEWSYKKSPGSRHIGPMAQDFYKAFTLGKTDKGISSIDTGGVALAAIQGLHAEVLERDNRIEQLEGELEKQQERMLQLELAVTELLRKQSPDVQVGSAN